MGSFGKEKNKYKKISELQPNYTTFLTSEGWLTPTTITSVPTILQSSQQINTKVLFSCQTIFALAFSGKIIKNFISISEKTNDRLCQAPLLLATIHGCNKYYCNLTCLRPLRPKKSLNSSILFCCNLLMQVKENTSILRKPKQYLDWRICV